jgi:hypothetical protein
MLQISIAGESKKTESLNEAEKRARKTKPRRHRERGLLTLALPRGRLSDVRHEAPRDEAPGLVGNTEVNLPSNSTLVNA